MATLSKGQVFGATEQVTNTKLHNLVDLGSITNIVDADCSAAMNLQDTKLAQITTASKVSGSAISFLPSIPSGAGLLPFANIPVLGTSYVSLVSIPNASLLPLTLTSWVDGSAMRNIQSMPSLAGQLSWYSICGSLASGGSPIFNGVDKFIGGNSAVPFSAGNYFVAGNFAEGTMQGTSPAKVQEIYIPRPGTLRIKFSIAKAGGTTVFGQIYRNGSAVGTLQSTTTSTGTQYSEDISGWSVGDLCQLYVYNSNGAQDTNGIELSLFEGTPITAEVNQSTYAHPRDYIGSSTPSSRWTGLGNIGDTFRVSTGGASTTLYVKTAASTWTAK